MRKQKEDINFLAVALPGCIAASLFSNSFYAEQELLLNPEPLSIHRMCS